MQISTCVFSRQLTVPVSHILYMCGVFQRTITSNFFFMTFVSSRAVCRVTIQPITRGCYMTCSDTLQIAAILSKCSESATFERECHLKEIEMKAEKDCYYSASCVRFTVTSAAVLTGNVHHELFIVL